MKESKVSDGLAKLDWSNAGGSRSPQQTAEFIRTERDRYGEFFKFIGRTPQ